MPPPGYPNILSDPAPQRNCYGSRLKLLAILVLVCLALRGAMALRIPSVVPDGVLYIQLAKALDAGDLAHGIEGMGLNTYPLILMLMHRTGLDWESAGVVWGVVIASLVVLPLYGWVRRQFDDRVAAAACLLYAVHPKTIEWSPEITRDSTFWFLLTLELYLLWRAVTEVRVRWFLAAGPVLILAVLTRFEGLVLVFPLVLWTFWRWLALREARARLVIGIVVCVTAVPLLAVLAAVFWWRVPLESLPVRLDPWARFQTWLEYLGGNTSAAQAGSNPLLPADVPPMSTRAMLREFFATMTRGLAPIYALLMFGGLWGWRRTWARRDHQALFYAASGVLVGIWVHLWYDRMICPRYAISIVLLASPFAALGFLGLLRRTRLAAEWLGCRARASAAWTAVPVAVVVVVSVAAAMSSNRSYFASRELAMELGRWVQRGPWTAPLLVGPAGITPIMSFYAKKGRCESFRIDTADASTVDGLVQRYHPDVVLLHATKRMDATRCEELAAKMKTQGFTEVDPVPRPARSDPLIVLVRQSAAIRAASFRPDPDAGGARAPERIASRISVPKTGATSPRRKDGKAP